MCLIRPFANADTQPCTAILALAGRDAFGPVAGSATFTAATQGEAILVAERGGIVTGFAAVYTGDAPDYFLHHLYVHPAHGGSGIGRQLLAAVVARFGPRLNLKTQLSNTGARRFYARAGWVEDAADSGVDAIGAWIRVRYRQ
ncbi:MULTISPECIES: GNAT family N-acetyltransferase [unclassified Janthinobacterium]|uniref:GNAT family N-acetyltransferase n=1 Tax=unclassified Janthinobacterium TaxID=2610881 RepID=UPI001E40469C|nr:MULTISPECIES: GNAT family N-acetyltransferase [unclassified Janthinobacterium]MCC7641929.1 GNAT family N-acetyltransferase [Janthinobacterium sp. EB271-G4-3-1]MCC7690055.1 GNAT family N-acetyltransferase [Janthinobacterium sp. EB271-G4-3-2]